MGNMDIYWTQQKMQLRNVEKDKNQEDGKTTTTNISLLNSSDEKP